MEHETRPALTALPQSGAAGGAVIEWRTDAAHWRWLLLGTLGMGITGACGGRADSADPTGEAAGAAPPLASGGTPNAAPAPTTGGTSSGGGPSQPEAPQPTRPAGAFACAGPASALGGNWERCANDIVHRAALGECPSALPRPRVFSGPFTPDDSIYYGALDAGAGAEPLCSYADCCFQDSDCTLAPYGHCEIDGGEPSIPYCKYGCASDSDCGVDQVCLCGDPIGQCIAASCRTDQDCGGTLACTPYVRNPGCPGIEFGCQRPDDTCASDLDCPDGTMCSPDPGRLLARSCLATSCNVGRPFLVQGRARLSLCRERSDWYPSDDVESSGPELAASALSSELREALRRRWLDQALMEHASVAAFARFALQLSSLGAPPELVQGAASAMLDEIRHAQACFGLARRFSDTDVGPGPLPLEGALGDLDLASIVVATIEEGCIGETLAALEATEAREHCADPLARRVLEQISRDETEHARLAWRFVAWALRAAPAEVRSTAARAFFAEETWRGELAAPPADTPEAELERGLLRHGIVSPALRAQLRRRVLREVVRPCAQALLGSLEPLSNAAARPSLRV